MDHHTWSIVIPKDSLLFISLGVTSSLGRTLLLSLVFHFLHAFPLYLDLIQTSVLFIKTMMSGFDLHRVQQIQKLQCIFPIEEYFYSAHGVIHIGIRENYQEVYSSTKNTKRNLRTKIGSNYVKIFSNNFKCNLWRGPGRNSEKSPGSSQGEGILDRSKDQNPWKIQENPW